MRAAADITGDKNAWRDSCFPTYKAVGWWYPMVYLLTLYSTCGKGTPRFAAIVKLAASVSRGQVYLCQISRMSDISENA